MPSATRTPIPRSNPDETVRERILDVASALFIQEGVRAVGVDTIVAASGVAKTSLYRHFKSKDELVAAFLQAQNERFWEKWDRVIQMNEDLDPRPRLERQIEAVASYFQSEAFRGCPFLNTATEFPEDSHPARAVCTINKSELQRRLRVLAENAGAVEPDALADGLLLLIDGASANTQVLGRAGPGRGLVKAAHVLINAYLP